jgi:hypothetical protein
MDELFDLSDHLKKYAERYKKDLEKSLAFLSWLNQYSPQIGDPTVGWGKAVYRIVYGGYHPLAIAGSLAAGGRFNIGGAQISSLFPNFSMRACIYAASSLECARKEAGEIRGLPQEYNLKPRRTLYLWNLKLIIDQHIPYPGLSESVEASPLAARWELQKVPKVSQILAHYVRQYGGDGLIYPSTKDRRQNIIAFFIKDDAQAQELFSIAQIK